MKIKMHKFCFIVSLDPKEDKETLNLLKDSPTLMGDRNFKNRLKVRCDDFDGFLNNLIEAQYENENWICI